MVLDGNPRSSTGTNQPDKISANSKEENKNSYVSTLKNGIPRNLLPLVRVDNVIRQQQVRFNVTHKTLVDQSDKAADYINEVCKDMLSQSIENMSQTLHNGRNELMQPVWVPWNDSSGNKPIAFSDSRLMTTSANNLEW
eukprot:8395396-Ditylum_brightwellii.AAC.1